MKPFLNNITILYLWCMEIKAKKNTLGNAELHPLDAIRLKVAEIKKRAKLKGQKIIWPK